MKLIPLLILAACSAPPRVPATPPAPVDEATAQAAYDRRQWPQCATLYETLATQETAARQEAALYNAACCHARDGKPDRAFAILDRLVVAGIKSIDHVQQDEDLASLRTDARWSKLIAGMEGNVKKWESSLGNPGLRRELLALMAEDQKTRMELVKRSEKPDQATIDALHAVDRKTTARMKEVIAAHGWPGKKLVGADGSNAAWLLVQHADLDVAFQKECLALIEKALAAGDVDAQNHAYLYDRVAVAENRPQRFGTQFGGDGEPQPIEDEANVDARRRAIGLPSMAEYRQQMRAMYGDPKK
jgi:hypothetical protein